MKVLSVHFSLFVSLVHLSKCIHILLFCDQRRYIRMAKDSERVVGIDVLLMGAMHLMLR